MNENTYIRKVLIEKFSWISVKKDLPEPNVAILFINISEFELKREVRYGGMYPEGNCWYAPDAYEDEIFNVTDWIHTYRNC